MKNDPIFLFVFGALGLIIFGLLVLAILDYNMAIECARLGFDFVKENDVARCAVVR